MQKNRLGIAPGRPVTQIRADLHVVDHDLAKAGAADLGRAFHEAGEVIGDLLGLDGFFHRADDQVGGLGPAHVAQHHFGREDLGARVHVCLLYTSPSPRDGLLSRMPSSA